MRVLFLSPSINETTGNARLVREQCRALIKAGHEPYVIGINYNDVQFKYKYKDVEIPLMPGFFDARLPRGENIQKIANYINQIVPDIVIAVGDPYYLSEDGLGNLDFTKSKKISYVIYATIDSEGEFTNKNQLQSNKRNILNSVDHIIATSEFGKRQIESWGYKDVKMIHEFVDLDQFVPLAKEDDRTKLRMKYKMLKDDKILLHIGRCTERKRQEILLEAAAELMMQDDKVKLYMVVPGYADLDQMNLKDFVEKFLKRKYGKDFIKEEKIIFLEGLKLGKGLPEDTIRDFYRCSNIYVSSSGGEGFGLPIVEAMASGTPVIVPYNSSMPEIVKKGGILADTPMHVHVGFGLKQRWTTPEILAKEIKKLLDDKDLYTNLRSEAIDQAKEFSTDKFGKAWLEILNKLKKKEMIKVDEENKEEVKPETEAQPEETKTEETTEEKKEEAPAEEAPVEEKSAE